MNKSCTLLFICMIACSCSAVKSVKTVRGPLDGNRTELGKIALSESRDPVHPGVPGSVPFWNEAAVSFIYAPAFNFKLVDGAAQYSYKIVSAEDKQERSFIAPVPYESLRPVWADVPTGYFTIRVNGLSANGDSIGTAGSGRYYRAAPFNGVYHNAVMPYDKSAEIALSNLLGKEYVRYWVTHNKPDPSYLNYCYPAKIYSALVIGAVTYAQLKPGTAEAAKAIELARIIADFMISIRYEAGSAWEYFVPTYYGKQYAPGVQADPVNNFTIMGVDAGNAFLDLYDISKDEKYLDAATKIAATYAKNQLDNGSWYLFSNYKTGVPVVPNIAIPTAMLNYFDRLSGTYHIPGLEKVAGQAFLYVMENPVKTYNWLGQFEDIQPRGPYTNLSREQACEFASYLMRHSHGDKKLVRTGEELIRFSEDQFVAWEKPRDKKPQNPGPGWLPVNWITPSVQEQYVFWNPVTRSAGVMLQTFWDAYAATHNPLYLAKARSIANAITLAQKEHEGDYPSFLTKYPMPLWLNGTVYPAKVMMNLENNLKKLK